MLTLYRYIIKSKKIKIVKQLSIKADDVRLLFSCKIYIDLIVDKKFVHTSVTVQSTVATSNYIPDIII